MCIFMVHISKLSAISSKNRVKENPEKYRELFKAFEILLVDGIIDTKFINNWADKILAKESESEFAFIELSTTFDINELVTLLNKLSEKSQLLIAQRAVFGILFNLHIYDSVEIRRVTRIVENFAYSKFLSEQEKNFLYGIDDFMELAINNVYGDFNKLKNEFWEFLEIYKYFNFENYNNWSNINNGLEGEIPENIQNLTEKYILKKKKWWKF